MRMVIDGRRPPRPVTEDFLIMSDAMWQLVQECWTHNPADRPLSSTVAQRLKDIVAAENLPTVPQEYVPVKQDLQINEDYTAASYIEDAHSHIPAVPINDTPVPRSPTHNIPALPANDTLVPRSPTPTQPHNIPVGPTDDTPIRRSPTPTRPSLLSKLSFRLEKRL